MLLELRVQGLAVISDARLELGSGLNVLTGETGAGKSLLVDALALLVGDRADSSLVRRGASRAVVEGLFDLRSTGRSLPRFDQVAAALDRLGIELDQGRVLLKREIQATGRSRAWVNGSPATVSALAELGELLVDLHGQHETQSLLKPDQQRAILDAFSGAEDLAARVAAAFAARQALAAEREALEAKQAEARRRADYLRHVADEIGKAAPKAGEVEQLESEARKLAHADELGRASGELGALLDSDDGSAASALAQAERLLATLERIDPAGSAGWRDMLDAAVANVDELARAVREYAEGIEADPARLADVERRRDTLFKLDRKYGPGLERVMAAGEEAARELDLLDSADADLSGLTKRQEQAAAELAAACKDLTNKRRAAARRLGPAVTKHLAGLGMAEATVKVALEALPEPTSQGAERVEFLCAMNAGLGERPVAKAASGGELSRLMLALKVELAKHDRVPVLVFDEVDAGIGGQVAVQVAEALASVAESHQVLVITHLPQIAAAAEAHFAVAKARAEGLVATDVSRLHGEDRVEEIARMIGGAATTARRHATELLKRA